jgi:hypothetical protein
MQLWADIYANDGLTRLGKGPVLTLTEARVQRALDEAGSLSFGFPASDARALEMCQNERWARVFVEHDGLVRELGRGIIRKVEYNGGQSETIRVEARGSLDALSRRVVGRNRAYNNALIADIAGELAALAGWTVEAEAGLGLQSARFSGASVLKALIRMCEEKGIHLREGEAWRSVEIGAFGEQVPVMISNSPALGREVYGNDELILIERLTLTQTTEAVANRVRPLGAGEGAAALTLKRSNRNFPYLIQSLIENGQTEYYLEDAASVAAYGVIERYATFKEIGPISNGDTAKNLAANALYDAAAAWLARNAAEARTYKVTGRKPRQTIRVGDQVRVRYAGQVWRDGMPTTTASIDTWMWVMSCTENCGGSGLTIEMELSEVDRRQPDMTEKMVGALEAVDVRNVSVQTFPYTFENVYFDPIAANYKDAKFRFKVTNYVTDLISVKINFRTFPLWTPATYFALVPPEFNWEVRVSPNYPSGVSLWIDGVDVSALYGGPWLTNNENQQLEVEADITALVLDAAGGLYQEHTIVLKCTSRFGAVEVYSPPRSNNGASTGMIEMSIYALGVAQAILPD